MQKVLQHQAEVTTFNRLERGDQEEGEEEQPKKGKKNTSGKEHETWLENDRKLMVTAKSTAQVTEMCAVAATGVLQEGIELNQALLKTKQVQKKNVPRMEAAIFNVTSNVVDKARQCVAEVMEDHQKVIRMLQQAQVALEPKAPEEQQSTQRKQMIQPADLPEELLFQEVEIEGEGAREELVIKLPRDLSKKQIPAARSPQKTPKKDKPCTCLAHTHPYLPTLTFLITMNCCLYMSPPDCDFMYQYSSEEVLVNDNERKGKTDGLMCVSLHTHSSLSLLRPEWDHGS